MRIAFLDDSEQENPPRDGLGHLLAFAAVIFPEESVAAFAADLADIRIELGVPPGEEIKWKPPKGSFLQTASGDLIKILRRRMLEAALQHEARTTAVIIDHGAVYKDTGKVEVGQIILEWVFERLSMHLKDHNDIGIVIADKPGGGAKEEKRWLAETLKLTNDGTEYINPGSNGPRTAKRSRSGRGQPAIHPPKTRRRRRDQRISPRRVIPDQAT